MPKKKAAFDSLFVPEEEQPYPIPENWCWTYLSCVAQWGSGGTPSRKILAYYDGEISWIKTGELNDELIYESEEHISSEAIANSSAKLFPIHTVIIAMYGATIGKVGILEIEAATNQACACAVSSTAIDYKYLFYYAKSQKEAFIKKGKGGAQPNISQEIIKTHEIPLPPLPEQHRIVNCIESLFAKLDEAKEKAQAVVDGFELRKSAILHKAFTGDLTEQWRKEHGEGLDGWKNTTLSEIVSGFKYGTSEKSTYNNTGMPVLRIPNVGTGTLSFEDMKYLAHNDVDEANQVHENDLLIIRSNGSRDLVGKCAIVPALSRKFAYASFLIRIKPSEWILPDYLALYLNSTDARTQMFKKAKSSAGIHNINSQELGSITINVPTIYEQSAIIAVLNNLLAKGQQAKEAAEAVLIQIDTMKKAILARAFRGELGTNDPAEEWAGEMVKAVL
jgi:Restriction endonuclease S subunits